MHIFNSYKYEGTKFFFMLYSYFLYLFCINLSYTKVFILYYVIFFV